MIPGFTRSDEVRAFARSAPLTLRRSVEQTSDGGFIFAGWSCSFSGYYDAYLVKTDANGNADWDRTYGGMHQDESAWARQTFHGGFISVSGTTSFGAGDWDVYLVRTDSPGDALWTTI